MKTNEKVLQAFESVKDVGTERSISELGWLKIVSVAPPKIVVRLTLPDYAQALDQACQILNIHRAHVVGNSVGAVLALETAASFPERGDKLVLVGCPVWDITTAKKRFKQGAQIDAQGMPTHQT